MSTNWVFWLDIGTGIIALVGFPWLARVKFSRTGRTFNPHERRALILMGVSGAAVCFATALPGLGWRSPYALTVELLALLSAMLLLGISVVSVQRLITTAHTPSTKSGSHDTSA